MLNKEVAHILARGFAKWLIKVGIGLNLILWVLVGYACCQEHRTQHKDRLSQEDDSGWMFITVTAKEDDLVFYRREGKDLVKLESMGWDKDSVIQDTTKVPFTGCYLAIFCRKHLYLYVLQRQPCTENEGIVIFRPKEK